MGFWANMNNSYKFLQLSLAESLRLQKHNMKNSRVFSRLLFIFQMSVLINLQLIIILKRFSMTTLSDRQSIVSSFPSVEDLDEAVKCYSSLKDVKGERAPLKRFGRRLTIQPSYSISSSLSYQKQMLEQHLYVMKKYLPVFSRINSANKQQIQPLYSYNVQNRLNGIDKSEQSEEKVGIFSPIAIQENLAIYFQTTNDNNQNLIKFLAKCTEMVQKSDQYCLTTLTKLVWSLYQRNREIFNEQSSIINYRKSIFDDFKKQAIQILKLRAFNGPQMEELIEFLSVYFITVLLVINQFFQNPYFKEIQHIETQDRAEFDLYGQKESKRKPCLTQSIINRPL